MKRLIKISEQVDKAIEKILVLSMAVMIITVLVQVFYRYIIVRFVQISLPFTEELARLIMIWITYLGLGLCQKDGMHASLDLIQTFFKKNKYFTHLLIIIRVIVSVFLIIVIIISFKLMIIRAGFVTPTLGISYSVLFLAPLIGSLLLFFRLVLEIILLATSHDAIEPE